VVLLFGGLWRWTFPVQFSPFNTYTNAGLYNRQPHGIVREEPNNFTRAITSMSPTAPPVPTLWGIGSDPCHELNQVAVRFYGAFGGHTINLAAEFRVTNTGTASGEIDSS